MRAVTAVAGVPAVTEVDDVPDPGPGQIRVQVRAAGLNNADLAQIAGRYPAPPDAPGHIPGLELAGTVTAVGPGVASFAVGSEVMALVGGGAQSEHCVFSERLAIEKAATVPWPEAGGFAEAFVTAHDALFTQCGLNLGDRVLIHGAAGGVGVAAVQLAVAAGADVIATVRAPERRHDVEKLGATVVSPEDCLDHRPFDIVLELATIDNMPVNLRGLATGGRISIIGLGTSGTRASIDFATLARRRASIHASTLRSRPLEARAAAVRAVAQHVAPLLASRRIHVPLTATYPLEEANAAYGRFMAGHKFGKIVLEVGPLGR